MKTLEEAAKQELISSYAIVIEGELVYQRQAMLNMFKKGADWQSKQSPWISVKERLPKDFKTKLILLKNGKVRTALLDSNYYPHNNEFEIIYFWHDREANESFDLEDVVAWMPIPSFDEILEANKDVLERIKEKGD